MSTLLAASEENPEGGFLDRGVSPSSDFSLDNVPFGVGSIRQGPPGAPPSSWSSPRCLTAIGDLAVDLSVLQDAGAFDDVSGLDRNVFGCETLNAYLEHPPHVWPKVRERLQDLFSGKHGLLKSNPALQEAVLHDLESVEMKLPVHIGDYTDFYSSREHATNVGTMFRGKDNALQPNWLHLPVGYHGRASTVFCSGRPIVRPHGQLQKDGNDPTQGSVFGVCQQLDFELEVAFFVGGPTSSEIGAGPLTIAEAKERIFGFVLMNDWSARDIQKWEYVPLGPFTSKNFATSISPWIVTTHALESFAAPTSAVRQDGPVPLEYLQDPEYSSYDIHLTVAIQSESMDGPHVVCRSNFTNLYWDAAQQLVHHSVTGCMMRPGDLLGSGTISGQTEDSYGSMLELSWRGTRSVDLERADGSVESRKFLNDGDTVIMKGFCSKPGHGRVGFGECRGKVLSTGSGVPANLASPSIGTDISSSSRYQDFKLYSFWKSSSAWRVRIALAAKHVPYTTIPVNIQSGDHNSDSFLEKNPMGQLPVLEYKDVATGVVHVITQSVAIVEFLDHCFQKSKALIPVDPMDRVAAMEMTEIINSGTQPLQNRSTVSVLEQTTKDVEIVAEFRRQSIRKGLQAMQRCVTRRKSETGTSCRKGPFAMGGFSPTIVDCYLVPQLYNARNCGIKVPEEFPVLAAVDDACSKHPWFVVAHPTAQPDAPTEARRKSG